MSGICRFICLFIRRIGSGPISRRDVHIDRAITVTALSQNVMLRARGNQR